MHQRVGDGAMTNPPINVVLAISLGGLCGAVLLVGLMRTGVLLRRISARLAVLQTVLLSIGEMTDPMTARVLGISGNVGNLRNAARELNRVVAERAHETPPSLANGGG